MGETPLSAVAGTRGEDPRVLGDEPSPSRDVTSGSTLNAGTLKEGR